MLEGGSSAPSVENLHTSPVGAAGRIEANGPGPSVRAPAGRGRLDAVPSVDERRDGRRHSAPVMPSESRDPGEADLLFELILRRYGSRLDAAQLEDLRRTAAMVADTTAAVRAVRLRNADEPGQPFAPFRADG